MKPSSDIEFIDLKAQYAAGKEAIDRRIHAVLDHGQYIMGPEVAELEGRLAALTGVRHCVTVSSGTDALLIALMALGVRPGDEVITTPFTFIATAEVILLLGAVPVFADVEADTGNLDAALIEPLISARTRAIMPVSLYGQPCDMDAIDAVAARHRLPVIEDAAQSFGASYQGRPSCRLSTIGCTSFFPSKPLGCYGDGGALFCDDDDLATAARELRVHGQSKRYVHTRVGIAGRMDTLQCAVVLAKLDRFPAEVAARARLGERYARLLTAAGIRHCALRPGRTSVHAQYTVLVDHRAQVQAALAAAGIPTAVHYPVPVHRQPAYRHLIVGDADACPRASALAGQVLSLPMHPDLPEAVQERIVAALADAVKAAAGSP